MDVIIDTNIIGSDFKLNNKGFEILQDYLAKTSSKVILPSIVVEEVKGLYRRTLVQSYYDYEKSLNKFNGTLVSRKESKFPRIDFDLESNNYIDYLNQKLNISEENIIHYKNEYLPELVSRAIERRKPLDDKGQQFRDGLLWLTLLDYAQTTNEKTVVFISNNSSDFAEKGKSEFALELVEEAKSRNLHIKYFRNLDDFAREHASVIEFISQEWIENNVVFEKVEKLFDANIDKSFELKLLNSFDFDFNEQPTGYIQRSSYSNSQIIDFYVYEKRNGTILLNIDILFEIEFEVEVEQEIEGKSSRYEHVFKYNALTDDFDWDEELVPGIPNKIECVYKYFYPELVGKYILTITDKTIREYEFEEWNWN